MTLPGVSVSIRDEAPPAFLEFDTGAAFVVGLTERGPVVPTAVRSLGAYVKQFGQRVTYGPLYDWLDVFFREGGTLAYVRRVVGDAADLAEIAIPHTGSGDPQAFVAKASSPGAWGDDLDVVVEDGVAEGTYRITVNYQGEAVESSSDLETVEQGVGWATNSGYISLTQQGADNPAPGTYALAGGDDDRAAVTEDDLVAALADFTIGYGPGQVAMPGHTSDAVHIGLLNHVNLGTRVALLDLQDSPSASVLAADVNAVRIHNGARFAAAFAPHVKVPGVAAGTTRTVAYSAVEAGMIARNDAATEDPGEAAAGVEGISRFTLDVTQPAWDDTDRETLNDAGVNIGKMIQGDLRTYAYRTIVNPVTDPRWVEFSGSRTVMAIMAEAYAIAERYEFAQIDGRGLKIAEFNGDLTAVCTEHYQRDALYGATPADAFSVNTGPSVNTEATIAARELHAVIALRTSPFAERVEVEVVRRLVTETV